MKIAANFARCNENLLHKSLCVFDDNDVLKNCTPLSFQTILFTGEKSISFEIEKNWLIDHMKLFFDTTNKDTSRVYILDKGEIEWLSIFPEHTKHFNLIKSEEEFFDSIKHLETLGINRNIVYVIPDIGQLLFDYPEETVNLLSYIRLESFINCFAMCDSSDLNLVEDLVGYLFTVKLGFYTTQEDSTQLRLFRNRCKDLKYKDFVMNTGDAIFIITSGAINSDDAFFAETGEKMSKKQKK